ncbi:unnamed protein product [Rotaria sp. Silwood2]|nr:unnamed protein product [Rotaria sp. Silwood2]CAF3131136.1 unnamed protein product [Rotaria sp. Silwood2]CAF4272843.1 unnamed protein product [Rotaria sp. Silwood2]CAF4412610.1 unnamed protein product [Rotaria sp. Silwood2]
MVRIAENQDEVDGLLYQIINKRAGGCVGSLSRDRCRATCDRSCCSNRAACYADCDTGRCFGCVGSTCAVPNCYCGK